MGKFFSLSNEFNTNFHKSSSCVNWIITKHSESIKSIWCALLLPIVVSRTENQNQPLRRHIPNVFFNYLFPRLLRWIVVFFYCNLHEFNRRQRVELRRLPHLHTNPSTTRISSRRILYWKESLRRFFECHKKKSSHMWDIIFCVVEIFILFFLQTQRTALNTEKLRPEYMWEIVRGKIIYLISREKKSRTATEQEKKRFLSSIVGEPLGSV